MEQGVVVEFVAFFGSFTHLHVFFYPRLLWRLCCIGGGRRRRVERKVVSFSLFSISLIPQKKWNQIFPNSTLLLLRKSLFHLQYLLNYIHVTYNITHKFKNIYHLFMTCVSPINFQGTRKSGDWEKKLILVCSKGQRFPFFHFRPTCVFVCGCGASPLAKIEFTSSFADTEYYIQATFLFFCIFIFFFS